MKTASRDVPTVLVTDAGRASALEVIRSLGRKGMRVIAADSNPRSPGFRSRFAGGRVCYPSPFARPAEAVDVLLDAVVTLGVDLLIPVTDEILLPVSAARSRFAAHCAVAAPDARALEVTTDKWATLALAESVNVPVPRTALVRSGADLAGCAGLGWPVVLKPQASRQLRDGSVEAFEVTYARDRAELAERMVRFAGRCAVLVQEYCPGAAHGVEVLMDRGRLLAAFQHRRLHEVPATGGPSSLRESVPLDRELLSHARRLLGAIEWTGLAMVEFKVGPRGPKLMEINGRVWGSLPLAVKSGMDFPARLADLYLSTGGGPTTSYDSNSYRSGVRSRNLELELIWILRALSGRRRYPFLPHPTRSAGLRSALRLLNPADGYDVLSLRDPGPGLADVRRIVRRILREVSHGGRGSAASVAAREDAHALVQRP